MPTIKIHFDGGCRPTNPGNRYGSWEVLLEGKSVMKASRVEFGYGTSNEAEWVTLIAALRWTHASLVDYGFDTARHDLELFTDSSIVEVRISGKWRSRCPNESNIRMGKLCEAAMEVAGKFKSVKVTWNKRTANVKRFGH